ncbi:glutamate--tRNA ligase [Candidatus Roizmanbacteria bacterium CG22_combo_CG10-13_8_21_14_all_38_20]|uniref:Glutamate--tRNA ligase n=1 Tax=Candidatus Roizmanbacteria bacterium CG22_combo_CG10-13_8_21_14_all_38_20 TaxID=1974862 RepID=A0A2H0BTW9_9BACT|nr:glutamate--tRNA ligase [Candidatus Microgenomates bacterium]PIP61054.1 MAG: glutamate--tRNA ligase [Candidatus Roizmanbacteria bacterium CG22_combo_CG10-13_8_21_14_all_38_20]PJC30840.1 MAG: glutamate--tRNA ligase [Candidatus Roizmanbacteria bacterium CG_4_9_14_0_2_um_filter_38_17]
MTRSVRTRIAPSPTGEDLHVGNAYTALLNFAYAKQHKGQFIVRIEDTDQKRKVEGSEARIFKSLSWLGLDPDESIIHGGKVGPYKQSKRLEIYQKYAKQLVEQGDAYYCDCTSERLDEMRKEQQKSGKPPIYDGKCRDLGKKSGKVVRLKMPNKGETKFQDKIRGEVVFKNELIDDQIILKSDGFPTYHLAVVIDDNLMGITHVIRGEEWLSSTPKHVQIYKALEWDLPEFIHTPLLRNPDKSKLSKRRNPVWVSWYKDQGLLPEAMLNYFGTLGFSMSDGRDIFTLSEFIAEFDFARMSKSAPIFDVTKLEWMNGEYIRKSQIPKLKSQIMDYIGDSYSEKIVEKSLPLTQTRIKKLSEYMPMCEFLFKRPSKYEKEVDGQIILKVIDELNKIDNWNHDILHKQLESFAEKLELSKSKLFMQVRIGVAGRKVGPPLFESLEILGKEETLERLLRRLPSSGD